MQPCIACIWEAGADEPSQLRPSLDRELTLDRELFGGNDASISRTANAPRLKSLNSRRVVLTIPAGCANGAVVIQRMDFTTLQRRVSSGCNQYPRTHAALLGRHSLVARAEHSALALLRAASPDAERPDQLVTLPATKRLVGPVEVELDAPCVLSVGGGAVAIMPGITVLPDSGDNIVEHTRRFRLPSLESINDNAGALSSVAREQDGALIRIAGWDEMLPIAQLPSAAKLILSHLRQRAWFVPALVDDRKPRLCLLYQRRDGSAEAIVAPSDMNAWLAQVERALEGSSPGPTFTGDASGTYKVVSVPGHLVSPAPAPTPLLASTPLSQPVHLGNVQTTHPTFAAELQNLGGLVDSDLSLLLLGESGTGKEHLARALHAQSKRARGPFVTINVASLPEALIETELFGHVKGAYTGTQGARDGAFVSAEGGTLLLDEIGDAPLRVQLALLTVLETRRVRAVGADRERPVDVRVIAATSRDLQTLMQAERFRTDLYFRIADVPVTVPPLRERLNDMPQIASAILEGLGCSLPLSNQALTELQNHDWPGNIRALRSTLRQAALLAANAERIEAKHLRYHAELTRAVRAKTPVEFPDVIRAVGDEAWSTCSLPALSNTQYERRAIYRAALIYLVARYGRSAFPAALTSHWIQLFGERWVISENQRGLRDVLRQLGVSPSDETVREWVLGLAGGGRAVRAG